MNTELTTTVVLTVRYTPPGTTSPAHPGPDQRPRLPRAHSPQVLINA
ncbi:MAG: hypothetical protein Q8P67_23150 [archaeon]|nr:hypothetical protein [archaeon]